MTINKAALVIAILGVFAAASGLSLVLTLPRAPDPTVCIGKSVVMLNENPSMVSCSALERMRVVTHSGYVVAFCLCPDDDVYEIFPAEERHDIYGHGVYE